MISSFSEKQKVISMKISYFIPAVFAGFLLSSCIDEIKLDIDTDQQRLVVDGLIADSLQVYTIKVNYSAIIGVGTDDLKTPVTGASVQVLDNEGGVFDFEETSPGTYTKLMQGDMGKAYHVEVKTADGKTILSRPTVLKKAPKLLTPTFKVIEEVTISQTGRNIYNNKLTMEMNTDISGMAERPFLRWRATGEFEFGEDYPGIIDRKICYIKNNIDFNNIKIFDTHELAGNLLTNEPFLTTKYDYRFFYTYCFHSFQYAISEDEYNYWQSVRSIVNIDGSLFDPPPGTVTGNLYNPDNADDQVLGYFSVAGVSYNREFVTSTELGVATQPRCGPWPPNQPDECFDCLRLPLSSTTRPSYWEP
jgi:Domain of unknown function (DUF4249)